MRHYVASATQAVKSEKKAGGGWAGGEEESRVKWTGETDLGGAQFIFVPERQLCTDMQIIPRTLQ